MEIESFSLTITADKELLNPQYKNYLNPFEIEIVGAKELPFQSEKNYMPMYARYSFFDGKTIQTQNVLQGTSCKWGNKHVFLLGFMDQTILKEKFNSSSLKVLLQILIKIINSIY